MRQEANRTLFAILRTLRSDAAIVYACFVCSALMILAEGVQYMLGIEYSAIPSFALLGLFCYVTWIRKSLSDPFSLILMAAFVYSAFPLLFGTPGSWAALRFGFEGASAIYAVGNIAIVLGIAIATLLVNDNRCAAQESQTEAALLAGVCSAVLACLLASVLVATRGSVLLGHVTYSESFRPEARDGAGVLLLAAPLAAAGLTLMMTSGARLRLFHHFIGAAGYCGLYLALGQRKYLLYPAMFYAVRYFRFQSVPKFLTLLSIAGFGMTVFLYLGFLRTEGSSYSQIFDKRSVSQFASGRSDNLSGESLPVFATASAAHDGFIAPLPYWGDYLESWMMCVPNFVSRNLFVPLNVRFAQAYDPRAAAEGAGWGFSFFGEAFLIGGYPLVAVASFIMMCVFRWFYVLGGRDLRSGLRGAISLSILPFTFWFQRNAFAYFVKEFLFLQVGTIVLAYYTASYIASLRRRSMGLTARSVRNV